MKHILPILLFLNLSFTHAQDLVINELVAKNKTSFKDSDTDEYPDWIELKNNTSATIDLSGFYLTDDETKLDKWQFPAGTVIMPNNYLLILADDIDTSTGSFTNLHANFKLSSGGETVVLSDASKNEIQRISYPSLGDDIAFGRLSDGSYKVLASPTPYAANDESSTDTILDTEITISLASGLYSGSQTINISAIGEGDLYYTLDGTTPDLSATPYTVPLNINTNTVLRVAAIKSTTEYSLTENRSYVFGASHDLPIILLSADNSTKGSGVKEKIDGRVAVNFIETDGTTVINQYANFRASGNTSSSRPQLNGKIEASASYGDNDFDHKFFPNKNIGEFKSLLLRNASQDWAETHMRDAFMSRLLSTDNLTDFPFEGYRPAVLYVNAVYQGIINIREDDDSDYIRDNYNLDDGDFKIQGRDLIRYSFTTDRAALENILNFRHHININFLIAYAQLNEWGFGWWSDLSGKTAHENHYFYHDFDATFGLLGESYTPIGSAMNVNYILPNNIKNHQPYKEEALQYIATLINHMYNKDRAISILNTMEAAIESEIPSHALAITQLAANQGKQAPYANIAEWKANVANLRTEIENRLGSDIFTRLQTAYSVEAPITVNYASSNINHGYIEVNHIKSLTENFTGTYFKNIAIPFKAVAKTGYRFVRWEGDITSTDTNISPSFSSNSSLTAIFEPIAVTPVNLVINEVQAKNDSTVADEVGEYDDWIEIYNPTSTDINLANFYISDDSANLTKWQIPATNASKTTVKANSYLLLWADKDTDQGENHVDFKLKSNDEVVLTQPNGITEIAKVSFTDLLADTSYGADVDGSTSYTIFNTPTPNASNSTTLSTTDNTLNKVSIYPNPFKDEVFISGVTNASWKLYNLLGKNIKQGIGNYIPTQDLSKGIYLLSIDNKAPLKLIKQ